MPAVATSAATTGGEDGGHDDLAEHAAPLDTAHADGCDGRTDQSAEQRVGRARRQAQQPRRQIPDDAADQAGEHDEQQILAAHFSQIHHALGNCRRNLHGQERADQIQRCGERDSRLGSQSSRRDRGGHCIAGVVKAVREIESEGGDDHHQENYELCGHTQIVRISTENVQLTSGVQDHSRVWLPVSSHPSGGSRGGWGDPPESAPERSGFRRGPRSTSRTAPPRFLPGLAVDLHPGENKLGLDRGEVANLQPQGAVEGGRLTGSAVRGNLDQTLTGEEHRAPPGYSRAVASPRMSR